MPEFGSLMQNIILSKDHRIVHYSIINSLQKVSLVTIYMYLCQQYNTFVPVTVFLQSPSCCTHTRFIFFK